MYPFDSVLGITQITRGLVGVLTVDFVLNPKILLMKMAFIPVLGWMTGGGTLHKSGGWRQLTKTTQWTSGTELKK